LKAVLQRVTRGEVRVDGEVVGRTGRGMVVLLGVLAGDTEHEAERLAAKVAALRFFVDDEGRMNRAAADVGASALVVSQFTLAADGRSGRRPSFSRAAPPEAAEPLYELFATRLAEAGVPTETGRFGAMMEVELVGDGPVTLLLEELPPGA
jgi:D-tyrosyl-tRNA(Tyr) deacylase